MKKLGVMLLCAASAIVCNSQSALAIKPFNDAFIKKYVDGNENTEFAEAAKAAKCGLCHVGKKKKDRNAYGMALAELLDKKADAKDAAKIDAAFETVAAMKAPGGEKTFGELIKEGKLPGGEPQ
jgi:hypothetical protein